MEIMDIIKEFIKPELIILVPVLYVIGKGLKVSTCKDKYIPFILGAMGIVLSGLYVFAYTEINNVQECAMATFTAITQGVLVAGASVYFNQILKQLNK